MAGQTFYRDGRPRATANRKEHRRWIVSFLSRCKITQAKNILIPDVTIFTSKRAVNGSGHAIIFRNGAFVTVVNTR